MPRKSKPSTKRPTYKPKRRMMRRRATVSELASAKQTLVLPNDTMGSLYTLYNVNLAQFDRLVQISQAYQYYRITKIEMKFKPFADTFTQGANNSVPYFVWLIDRNENMNFATNGFQQMREAGAKPIRFDDKTVNVRWRPTVLQTLPANDTNPPNVQTFNNSKISPWLPTNYYAGQETATYQWNASTVPHRGIVYGVQQDLAPSNYQYGTEITVHVQFKKPSIVYSNPKADEFVPATSKEIIGKPNPSSEVVV